jgi:arylsulfatase
MNRRSFLSVAAGGIAAAQKPADRPNVIIVLTDDQGYGDLSRHGNPVLRTPNLDRLGDESIRLTDFHVAPMCTPTRSQLMSGKDALANCACNVSSGRTPMRTDLPTMADVFAGNGYATGIFGKWHLGDNYPYRPEDRGFQEAVWFPSSHIGSAPDAWNNDYFNDSYRHNGRLEPYEGYCTDVFFGEAMEWMRRQKGQPFFTYIALNAPHGPLFVPDRYKQPYAGQPPNVASFFGMIANIDENMGRLEKMLEETGLRENTILVFMTDNGGTAGVNVHNAGMRGRKIGLYDGGHRVPFFIRWPRGLKGGRDIGALTAVQDVLPTMTGLCGLKRPADLDVDGVSLAGLLRGEVKQPADRKLVTQIGRMNLGRPQWGDAAVMWRNWRLVGMNELYDINKDAAQRQNVVKQFPEVAKQMRAHYEGWWKTVEPRLDTFLPVHLGSERENPVLLSPTEWADVFLDQGNQIRAGDRKNGLWHVAVERDGQYEFTLRRWARTVDAPMRAGLPPYKGEIGQYPAGVALPVAKAEMRLFGRTFSGAVGPEDRELKIRTQLGEGRSTLQTWFYDEAGRDLSGAYYVYAERLNS